MEVSSDIWKYEEDSTMPRKAPSREHVEQEVRWALGVQDRRRSEAVRPAARAPRPATPVGVLDRAVAIMDAVEAGARSFTDIVEATGLPLSSAHRLIGALEDHGLLFHVGGLGYALGPRLLGLASAAMRELPLRELARPALERLARSTGESTQLYVRDGDRRICVDTVESDHELRTIVDVGASLPLTKGSAGKVFLAWGPPPSAEPIDDHLSRQVTTTFRRGWADSVGEREAGVASVSAPILGPGGELLAAISVSGPASRLAPLRAKTHAPAVVEAAREVEALLR
jgi:DNA-binding IclR family transcriptional regulator